MNNNLNNHEDDLTQDLIDEANAFIDADAAASGKEQEESEEQPAADEEQSASEENASANEEDELTSLRKRVSELEDIRLRQMAEFDNYRRRTNREKLDLMSTAGEKLLVDILPLVDDFERAKEAMNKTEDIKAVREGIDLIYQKFISWLDKQDVHAIETEGADFNTDEHEAITTFAAGEDKKGKIIDCTQKGYKLGDKVIRYAKVVVGE